MADLPPSVRFENVRALAQHLNHLSDIRHSKDNKIIVHMPNNLTYTISLRRVYPTVTDDTYEYSCGYASVTSVHKYANNDSGYIRIEFNLIGRGDEMESLNKYNLAMTILTLMLSVYERRLICETIK